MLPGAYDTPADLQAQGFDRLAQWQAGELAESEGELRAWRVLQRLAGEFPSRVWLGYGLQDRFASGLSLMAASLSAGQVITLMGGHDWPTWRALWEAMLQALVRDGD
jgi:hypothetical protein